MLQKWPTYILWALIMASLVLVVLGLAQRRPWRIAAGALLSLPLTLYLSLYPGVFHASWILSVLLMAASFAAHRRWHRVVATVLVLPYVAVVAWLAYVVVSQQQIG